METIEVLNARLIEHYGVDTVTGQPMFRISWANDQLEKRLMKHSLTGIELLYPQVFEVPKYPYLKDLYVLERLVIVPDTQQDELPTKLSYEPIWTFADSNRNYLYPIWDATKFVVDTVYAALGKKSMAKYVDDEKNTTKEGREERITELAGELFGNENETTDALAYKEGIVVPSNYSKGES